MNHEQRYRHCFIKNDVMVSYWVAILGNICDCTVLKFRDVQPPSIQSRFAEPVGFADMYRANIVLVCLDCCAEKSLDCGEGTESSPMITRAINSYMRYALMRTDNSQLV
jgi:hypothetical protein